MFDLILPFAAETAGKEESSTFLVSPDVGLMIWTLLAFFATLFILNKVAFPRIKEALDRRVKLIEDSIESAELSKVESEAPAIFDVRYLGSSKISGESVGVGMRESGGGNHMHAGMQYRASSSLSSSSPCSPCSPLLPR